MIQPNDNAAPEAENNERGFKMVVQMIGHEDERMVVEGTIQDRWFALSWEDNGKVTFNVSRKPMCRDDFWSWSLKKRVTWLTVETGYPPPPLENRELVAMVLSKVVAEAIQQHNGLLRIKLRLS